MKKVQIQLSAIKDVQDFTRALTAYPADADLESGRYLVDAKSIMGFFSLDLQAPITLTLHGTDEQNEAILNAIKPFVK